MFRPKFLITNEALKNVGVIEASREVIDSAPLVPAWEAKFKEDAEVRAVHYGTHVEGNDLTLAEAEKVMRQDPQNDEDAKDVADRAGVVARTRDVQEVINYRNVLKYINQLVAEAKSGGIFEYKEEQLMRIHGLTVDKVVTPAEVGSFRKHQVVIKGVENGEIVHRPPNAVEVSYQVEELFTWLNSRSTKELHPVLKAAVMHYELSRIHPFTEGNGRSARAMVMLILGVEGIDARRFFSIEEHFDKNIIDYYRAFVHVEQNGGDMTGWIEFFSKALAIEMSRVKDKVKRLSIDMSLRGKMGQQIALNERQVKLIEFLENCEAMTMNEARSLLPMVSDDTLLRDLKDLIKKDLVRKKGKTKGARYVLRGLVK